ncbi:hypothetical protein [Aurantiacibacter zhengii]|uniref:Glycosyl transferase family 28 C-terminal domain-containing protein n=1 Tax=Aurantiacibacter zhengii TaxID=2307003 RepID=A0A418NR52_9SPHN|nr:hypothetical protein [Aurantiacibacter zhengii]RIV85624.1 hypothetical protein D2V07_09755 [Aurantiacibacter zhengii]
MSERPVGYFVHHQGRGHAERAGALANEMVAHRPVTLFCARTNIFPRLDPRIELCQLPSLFEANGGEPPKLADWRTPDTLHCAPLGWHTIRHAVATIAQWFDTADAALFVTDVSAELGQLARIASVPHVAVLQHGDRSDAGHMSSYESAVGILAPYSRQLEQPERPGWMRDKTHYAPGLGISPSKRTDKAEARKRLNLPADKRIVLVIAGGGGTGTPTAPLTLGARDDEEALWITIGNITSEWHETPPGNLSHKGWVDNPEDWIAAADGIVSSCGNTTVHMVAAAGKPWIVVPEWRYFDEQLCKADALEQAGLAAVSRMWPSHVNSWRKLWDAASRLDHDAQQALVEPAAARDAADWLDGLICSIWAGSKSANVFESAQA